MTRWARGDSTNKRFPFKSTPSSAMGAENDLKKNSLKTFQQKDKRREDRRLKRVHTRQKEKVCYNCRKNGHLLKDCTEIKTDDEQGIGICFKCGSTEHRVYQCNKKVPEGTYPHAKCFICKKQGHLSSQCPDNSRGVYPRGGGCNLCGSVEHFMKACPRKHNKESAVATVGRIDFTGRQSADTEPSLFVKATRQSQKGPKVVAF